MFKLYSCKLRIGGSVLNEIRKSDVTAPEIDVLRKLHGADAVLEIKETGEVQRSDRAERDRIEGIYASPTNSVGESLAKKQRMLADLFGHARNPLPKVLEDAPVGAEEDVVEPEVTAAPIKRTPVKAQPAFAE
jgi:hypothetical protein